MDREVHNIVQKAANKITPKKKKSMKAKWLSEETLQIAKEEKWKTREKGKDISQKRSFPKNGTERQGLRQWTVYKTRRKQQNGKD